MTSPQTGSGHPGPHPSGPSAVSGAPWAMADGAGAPGDLASLLRAAARGDEAAFAELYDETAPRVHGVVLRVIRDRAQAEEITQEVYIEVWRTASRYRADRGSVGAWLTTLAHRRAVDRVRSAEASIRRDTTYHDESREIDHDATADAATSALEAARVHKALAALTAAQREAVKLAFFGGYTHTEVADLLDLPVGTAKTRIRDGLIRLRDQMGVAS